MDDVQRVDSLQDAVVDYGFAYLLTVGDDGRPHAVAVTPRLADGHLQVDDVGSRSLRNLAARPDVSFVWPPRAVDEYSLIADGVAAVGDGGAIVVAPSRAVLHRPGRAPQVDPPGEGCASDCRELRLA
ncbi:pyridoxamine 5'-phosphate oxidase family protein [Spelaeicoccus albus]|uniref:Pyridoxamine 5'-phosphate oxidase n=1 Tax=Spelaeicoccus albus TaxID=1280376 RepID=A0A7Z0D1L2_9MICO|nr:pyridoxamine 5'-phosphate oxidase family protein [Spelaeicoccus albus]NYI67238.1 hypothetical protein [Spelaeicoccus albus]